MLKELDLSWDYHKYLQQAADRRDQIFWTSMLAVLGALATLGATAGFEPALLLIGPLGFGLGIMGFRFAWLRIACDHITDREGALRKRIHLYFRQFDTSGFDGFGGMQLVANHDPVGKRKGLDAFRDAVSNFGLVSSLAAGGGFAWMFMTLLNEGKLPLFNFSRHTILSFIVSSVLGSLLACVCLVLLYSAKSRADLDAEKFRQNVKDCGVDG